MQIRTRRTIVVLGGWAFFRRREAVRWVGQFGPIRVIRRGLPFDRKAARELFDVLHNGPVGRLAKAGRECNQREGQK